LDKNIDALLQLLQLRIRMVLTEHLMTLTLPPDNCLRLGRDLSVPYPTGLVELINVDLLALLAQVDPTPNSVLQTGTNDWANLQERMHYIADLFRCYHQSGELFDAAFIVSQVAAMKNGQLPEGKL